MGYKMSGQFGLQNSNQFCKKQFRWIFEIEDVCGDPSPLGIINSLPPEKASRPSFGFKEMEVKHMTEDVFLPGKSEWKPINITLFDLKKSKHPVFEWLKRVYSPINDSYFKAPIQNDPNNIPNNNKFFKTCYLKMLDGTGETVESWVYEDAWPNSINFQALDMNSQEIMMCEITLRYARAYIDE